MAGEALHEGVGHHLAAATLIAGAAGGVGFFEQGGVGGDTLGDREQGGEAGHRLGGGAQADPAVGVGTAHLGRSTFRIEAVGQLPRFGLDPAVPQRFEVRGEQGVHGGAVLTRQPRGFAGDQHGPPLRHPPVSQRGEGVGQFAGEDRGPADIAAGMERRDPPSQPDLPRDAAPDPVLAHPGRAQRGPLRRRERRRLRRLHGRGRGLDLLEQPDPIDPHPVGYVSVQAAQRPHHSRQ